METPPRAALIQISPGANGEVFITGAPGAVAPSTNFTLVNLASRHLKTVRAAADGSFQSTIFGLPGTHIYIRSSTYASPGTILRVADSPHTGPGVPFSGVAVSGLGSAPSWPLWHAQGTLSSSRLQPGETLRVGVNIAVESPVLVGIDPPRLEGRLDLEQVAGPDGMPSQARGVFFSTILTPTGLPLERHPTGLRPRPVPVAMTRIGPSRVEAQLDLSLPLAPDLPPGYYAPLLEVGFQGLPAEASTGASTEPIGARSPGNFLYLPLIRVGDPAPPRLGLTLLADDVSGASRGVVAIEDRQRFGVASHIVTNSDVFVIPAADSRTGSPLTYRLEPFALGVSVGDRGHPPEQPLIPFKFPSGKLTVEVQRPDGTTARLGPKPFLQPRTKHVVDRATAQVLDGGGPVISEAYELSTMDPRFEVQFSQDGLHLIRLDGEIEDIWGNVWRGGGTYEIWVARPLSLDTAVLPGMVFEAGDVFHPGLTLTPPMPASIDVRFRLAPNSNAAQTIERRVQGVANRFGYFHGGAGIALDQPGEYRVDLTATYRDAQGNLWKASRTWGGVVAPRNPAIIAHGKRGLDQTQGSRPQWYFRSQTEHPNPSDGSHVQFAFHTGDVMWLQKSDSTIPQITFQDPSGPLLDAIVQRSLSQGLVDIRGGAIGETPLFSSSAAGVDAHIDPSKTDIWGYAYASVQRPLVRVREEIFEQSVLGYWRFSDQYGGQIGMGNQGDLENDIKFQYGGVVLRGPGVNGAHYAVYGSLFVLVPDNDPLGGTRVFPPFQGNGGGPTGGPVMRLKGKDVDLFLHLTGVRPGSVLEVGDTFAIAGAVGPTLPALVSYSVTSPGGRVTRFSGRANKVGYYYRPEHDFEIQEPGMYTVDLQVSYDGVTSAGQVTPPFPTGDVLGTAGGRFFVYVVPRNSAPLAVNVVGDSFAATAARMHMTTIMPGFLMETREIAGNIYRFNAQALARDFPNLDPADVVTISLLDPSANRAHVLVYHGPEFFNTGQAPVLPRPTAAANAASYGTALTPGGLAALFGENLASLTAIAPGVPLPTTLGGATVQLNGIPAPLYYASPGQINFQVPWELAGNTQASLSASGSAPIPVDLAPASPGIFAVVRQGRFLILYCTGLGDVTNRPATGAPAPADPLSITAVAPSVTVGGVLARVVFSGLAPGFAGLYQVNVELVESTPPGSAVPVVLSISGAQSNVARVDLR